VAFAIMLKHRRTAYDEFSMRADKAALPRAHVLHDGGPLTVEAMLETLGNKGFHGALDGTEGAVWIHENDGTFSAIAKYVKHDKVDGRYLSSNNGGLDIINYSGPVI
jgi:hypothetical protein